MRAVVLVGGEGTRLRPLTFTTPKQLLPVVEVPMIERVLAHLAEHGVEHAVLSLGYRPDAFLKAYPSGVVGDVSVSYAVEAQPLDTAGAVGFAAHEAGIDETFVVVNGDVLTDADLSALVAFHRRSRASATIQLTAVNDPSRFGVVPTDDAGRVIEFLEKPSAEQAPTNLINAGTYVVEPEVLSRIPSGRRVSIERETFPQLASLGSLYALASDSYWLDTGTPEAYLQAHYDLLEGRRGRPPAATAKELVAGVWALGVAQTDDALVSSSLLGESSVVSKGAVVERSVVGAGCRIGPRAVVVGSVLLPGATVGPRTKVVGSIIGHRAQIGEGCVLEPLTVVGDAEVVDPGTTLLAARVPAEALL